MRFALRFKRIRSANCIEEGSVKRLSRHKAARRRGASLFIPRPLDLEKEMETINYSVCYPLTNVAGPEISRELFTPEDLKLRKNARTLFRYVLKFVSDDDFSGVTRLNGECSQRRGPFEETLLRIVVENADSL